MRLASLALILAVAACAVLLPACISVSAQIPNTHYVVLYAHDIDQMHVLNASNKSGGTKAGNVTQMATFALQPTLGEELAINGAVTLTAYLRSNVNMAGTLEFSMSERTESGEVIPVSGVNIEAPVSLGVRPIPYTVGIGIITYKFQSGSSILVHIQVQPMTPGSPFLVWDDSAASTRVMIPAISPVHAELGLRSSTPQFGRIIESPTPSAQVSASVLAYVRDAFGSYRFAAPVMQLTSTNGATITARNVEKNETEYTATYFYNVTLEIGKWQMSFNIADFSGDSYRFTNYAWVTEFYPVEFLVVDNSGVGVDNASVIATFLQDAQWSTYTNSDGRASLFLPSTANLGSLNATVSWKGAASQPSPISIVGRTAIRIPLPLADTQLHLRMSNLPLLAAEVTLYSSGREIGRGTTGLDGSISFGRLPASNYTIRVQYLLNEYNTAISLGAGSDVTVNVPLPYGTEIAAAFLGVVAVGTGVVVRKRRSALYPQGFDDYYDRITMGGLPQTCFVVVAGNSGSGKSVLLETLAAKHLTTGNCVFVTNNEYPSKIRESMNMLGILPQGPRRLIFLDAYSALSGTPSVEEYSVPSLTDLTALGLTISRCMGVTGEQTDVFLDSLNPLLAALRVDYLLNFLQAMAARVKANGGRFYVSVGLGIEKSDITKLEEASDCVIETQLQDEKHGQSRRMRIKKLRGQSYIDKWTRFRVERKKGIIFLSREKPRTAPS